MLSESLSPTFSSSGSQEETKNLSNLLEEKPEIRTAASACTMPLSDILLPENLTRIFEFMSLPDRKNIRLTCKLWYECSLKVSITRREKFVIRPNFNFSDISKTLLSPIFPRLNLEFQGLRISRRLADEVWETCGPRVYSLNLYQCCLDDGVIRLIIDHCINLVELKIGDPSDLLEEEKCYRILPKLAELDYFVEKNMTRLQLLTFTLATETVNLLGKDILSKIVRIFPHIEHLHIESLETFEKVDEVKLPLQIKDFVFKPGKFMVPYCWLDKPLSSLQGLRLRKFDVALFVDQNNVNLMEELILKFFCNQKNLEVINLDINTRGSCLKPRTATNIIFHALENCSNLQEFCMFVRGLEPLQLSCNKFIQLLTLISNLYCFNTDFVFYVDEPLPPLNPENSILHTLSLTGTCWNEDIIIFFLKYHSGLKHLKIDDPSDKILQEIFKTMPSLQTLVLIIPGREDDRCTKSGFTYCEDALDSKRASIKQLQKLEHLEIENHCINCPILSEATAAREFQFPNLKCLKLRDVVCFDLEGTESVLYNIILNIPTLEVLEVSGYQSNYLKKMSESESFERHNRYFEDPWNLESMIDFCRFGKNLRLLSLPQIGSAFQVPDLESKFLPKLFQACLNLRYFLGFDSVHSFNPFTKQISQCCRQGLKFPESRSTFESIELVERLYEAYYFKRQT